jgi:peptidoglycan LD-endopeptidase LytH
MYDSHAQPRSNLPALLLIGVAAVAAFLLLAPPEARQPARVAALLARTPPRSLPVPVAGVRASGLSNTWGAARSGGRRHEGIDIFAHRNTPIRSTTEGLVVSTSPNPLGGRCIVVLGPGGQRHYYAHLERHGRFETGDWVRAGDTIGFVGNSGNARTTPPHLHYGIYTANGAINPFPLLARPAKPTIAKTTSKKKGAAAKKSRRGAVGRAHRRSRGR